MDGMSFAFGVGFGLVAAFTLAIVWAVLSGMREERERRQDEWLWQCWREAQQAKRTRELAPQWTPEQVQMPQWRPESIKAADTYAKLYAVHGKKRGPGAT